MFALATGLGLISFGCFAAARGIGPRLFDPAPNTEDWFIIHDEERDKKTTDCFLAAPDVVPRMNCGPAERAQDRIDRAKVAKRRFSLLPWVEYA